MRGVRVGSRGPSWVIESAEQQGACGILRGGALTRLPNARNLHHCAGAYPHQTSLLLQVQVTGPGRVALSGVQAEEVMHLWDAGMQRVGPNLVRLHASAQPPPDAPADAARPAKRRKAVPAAAAAAGTGAASAPVSAGTVGAVATVQAQAQPLPPAPAYAPAPVAQQQLPPPPPPPPPPAPFVPAEPSTAGLAMMAEAEAELGALEQQDGGLASIVQLRRGGALLLDVGRALGFGAPQRLSALRAFYALAKQPGQLEMALLLGVGLQHVKAAADAGELGEAWVLLREVLPGFDC